MNYLVVNYLLFIFEYNQTNKIMNDSKTYTISEDLFKAILENTFTKGQIAANCVNGRTFLMNEAIKEVVKLVEDQQYIYENRLTEEA